MSAATKPLDELFLARQPLLLVRHLLRQDPSAHVDQLAAGFDNDIGTAALLIAQLIRLDLIDNETCGSCGMSHGTLTEQGRTHVLAPEPPDLSSKERQNLLNSALVHLRGVARDKEAFPFTIDRVVLPPSWILPADLPRSFVHVVVRLTDERFISPSESFSDEEQALLESARAAGQDVTDYYAAREWLGDRYLERFAHPDPRVCIAVTGADLYAR